MSNMSIFCCCFEGISMSSIFSCTTQMCFQMKFSGPPGVIWQDISTSTRSQVAEVSWSGNCLTPVSWELSPALQRWAFQGSWAAQVFEHLLIHWPYQLKISCTQNLQYCWLGFNCENLQIVNTGHSMQYNGLVKISLTTVCYHPYAIQWFIWIGWG